MAKYDGKFVSRGGEKLDAAIEAFGLDVTGWVCADFGCNVGGFTDCLLQRGASKIYAIDTGYGELAWRLRKDDRVVVMERTNALHCDVPEPVDLVVADMAWTPQSKIIPAATKWLKPAPAGAIVSLVKPHYELAKIQGYRPRSKLTDQQAKEVCSLACSGLDMPGLQISAAMESVIRGKGGNCEFLLLLGRGVKGLVKSSFG